MEPYGFLLEHLPSLDWQMFHKAALSIGYFTLYRLELSSTIRSKERNRKYMCLYITFVYTRQQPFFLV